MQHFFNCAMNIGEEMLVSGAEVHRVEDSIRRMCSSLGALRTDVFIITTSMVVTVYTESGNMTQTRRIASIGTDIERLHRLNALSRRICNERIEVEEIEREFDAIKSGRRYSFFTEVISYMMIAGAFALFFGGRIADSVVAMLIGASLRFLVYLSDRAELNKIFTKFFCSLFLSLLAYGAHKIGIIDSIDKVIIGNIMLLIPGVGLTNGLRDLLMGDSIAGLLRLIEAILSALAIAAGYFLFVVLLGGGIAL